MNNVNPIILQSLRGFMPNRAKEGHGTIWTCASTLGEGDTPVTCHFNTDEFGNPTDTQVWFNGVDVMPILGDAQLDHIYMACIKSMPAQLKEWNDDMLISRRAA